MKYPWIEAHRDSCRVTLMCQLLGVSRSGVRAARARPASARAQAQRYAVTPAHWLADGGFTKLPAIEQLAEHGTAAIVPPPNSRNPDIDPYKLKSSDSAHLAAWRQRGSKLTNPRTRGGQKFPSYRLAAKRSRQYPSKGRRRYSSLTT